MKYAFPSNEIDPITCKPNNVDFVPIQALTLIESLDTLIVLNDIETFEISVKLTE